MDESILETYEKLKTHSEALPFYEEYLENHTVDPDDPISKWNLHKNIIGNSLPHIFGFSGVAVAIFICIVVLAVLGAAYC